MRPYAEAGGREIHAIRLAAGHDFGVASDHAHLAVAGGLGHAIDESLQQRDLGAFLDEGIQREVVRHRTGDRQVVDGAVHRQRADVAARELQRLDRETVGGHDQHRPAAAPGCWRHRGSYPALDCPGAPRTVPR